MGNNPSGNLLLCSINLGGVKSLEELLLVLGNLLLFSCLPGDNPCLPGVEPGRPGEAQARPPGDGCARAVELSQLSSLLGIL